MIKRMVEGPVGKAVSRAKATGVRRPVAPAVRPVGRVGGGAAGIAPTIRVPKRRMK